MDILIVGVGYVGLVTAACFAEMGHQVICLDTDKKRIEGLLLGVLPFFEPGLQELVERNTSAGRLQFTTDSSSAIASSSVAFLALPTPSGANGACDLSYVLSAAEEIGNQMQQPMVIVNKSTVPVGTAFTVKEKIAATLAKEG